MCMKNKLNITYTFTTKADKNLAFHVNDNPLHVVQNHKELARKQHYKFQNLVHMKQIHSNIVHIVDENDNFDNPPTCDALITNKKDVPLMVMVADCSPVIFSDVIDGVIAVAHAGRAGAFKNIIQNVVDSFVNEFHAKKENIHVEIGASIGVCCYEVGEEIYEEAKALGFEYAVQLRNSNYYLDIKAILKQQLINAGVKNFIISEYCNCCNSETYFSYRKEKETGRFAGVVTLKE